jgi:Methyltransferase domain
MAVAAWLWAGRAFRNAQRAIKPLGPISALVDELAPGRSFLDVGALWNVDGATAFRAEEQGATAVTAMDVSAETDTYREEHMRRGSSVRFVCGDLHDAAVRDHIGPHDVVWCSGVLYHCPNPMHSLGCLRELTRQILVLITASVPELPGIDQASVFFPGLSPRQARQYARAYDATLGGSESERVGLTTPFDADNCYGNWWWGMTPSAITAMLHAAGFTGAESRTNGFHTRIVANVT